MTHHIKLCCVYILLSLGALDHGVKLNLDETDGPSIQQSHLQLPSVSDMLICYPTLEGIFLKSLIKLYN